jgi:hypothetical protein
MMCHCEQLYLLLSSYSIGLSLLIKFGGLHARNLLRFALLVALLDNLRFP